MSFRLKLKPNKVRYIVETETFSASRRGPTDCYILPRHFLNPTKKIIYSVRDAIRVADGLVAGSDEATKQQLWKLSDSLLVPCGNWEFFPIALHSDRDAHVQ